MNKINSFKKRSGTFANKRITGKKCEEAAILFLRKEGFGIVERNFRTRRGEIDIIAQHGNTIIFIEVKSSGVYSEESLEYTIDNRKQKRIIETAKWFLSIKPDYKDCLIRFDVIFVSQGNGKLLHIINAFEEVI